MRRWPCRYRKHRTLAEAVLVRADGQGSRRAGELRSRQVEERGKGGHEEGETKPWGDEEGCGAAKVHDEGNSWPALGPCRCSSRTCRTYGTGLLLWHGAWGMGHGMWAWHGMRRPGLALGPLTLADSFTLFCSFKGKSGMGCISRVGQDSAS